MVGAAGNDKAVPGVALAAASKASSDSSKPRMSSSLGGRIVVLVMSLIPSLVGALAQPSGIAPPPPV